MSYVHFRLLHTFTFHLLLDSSIPLSSIFIFVFSFSLFSHSFIFHPHLFCLTIPFLSLCFSLVLTHSQFLINNLSLLVSVGLTSSRAPSTSSIAPPSCPSCPPCHHCPLPTKIPSEQKPILKKKNPRSTPIKT